MASTDIQQTTQTDLAGKVTDYSVTSGRIDQAGGNEETYWDNTNFEKYLGYYYSIPEFKKAVDTYATWVLGKGYTTDARTNAILENITGWGEDSFLSILWNMLVVKKFNGDSYSEIMRDPKTGIILNLKPLNPSNVRHVVGKKGIIKFYEYTQADGKKIRYKPNEIFHLCNDRIADQIHGTSVVDCVEWVILARNEAMADWKRISHRATIRVMYVDEDDKSRLVNLKKDYAEAIKNGELLIIPGKRGEYEFQDLSLPPADSFLSWIQYLENFFYQAVGVPKAISGGVQDNTEASAKVGMVVFDPIYLREITDLQMDIWNQLAIKIEFVGQKSMMDNVQGLEQKNNAQTGFQPNDVEAGVGK